MPKINEMLPSNYLKQSDFDQDYIVTIRSIEQRNIAMDGKPEQLKWLAFFEEFDKPMVLNSTNIQLMAKACGSEDSDDWVGKQVIVYTDPNVSFGGELVGGLRVKPARVAPPARPKAAAAKKPCRQRRSPKRMTTFRIEHAAPPRLEQRCGDGGVGPPVRAPVRAQGGVRRAASCCDDAAA
jgi:hypothetical protein